MVVKMAIVVSQVKMLMILTAMIMVIKDDNIIQFNSIHIVYYTIHIWKIIFVYLDILQT